MNPNRILVTDDEPEIGAFIAEVAEENGFDVAVATDADEFWKKFADLAPTVITLDLQMPYVDGIEYLRLLAERDCHAGILLISGQDNRVLSAAKRLGADRGLNMLGVLSKPVMLDALESVLVAAKLEEPPSGAADLREAIEQDQLVVHYQPKTTRIPRDGWRIDGVEALVRWAHPRRGIIMPGEFIPLAESSGLIAPMTDKVIKLSLDQLKHWRESGLDMSMAVNISALLLDDLDLPDRIFNETKLRNIPPSALILEVTESAAMADPAQTMDILTRSRLKEFMISLDDFGTGYSSLAELYRMPFNELKVDRSFISELTREKEAHTIVRLIINLAHDLGLTVCGEGVEQKEELDTLESMGCERAQGYLISKPVPAEEIPSVIEKWNGLRN